MQKIKMITTALGADCEEDGRTHGVREYLEGETYIVGQRLSVDFCDRLNVAVRAEVPKAEQPSPTHIETPETESKASKPKLKKKKDLGAAPENKSGDLE